jgi:hypothetical protein
MDLEQIPPYKNDLRELETKLMNFIIEKTNEFEKKYVVMQPQRLELISQLRAEIVELNNKILSQEKDLNLRSQFKAEAIAAESKLKDKNMELYLVKKELNIYKAFYYSHMRPDKRTGRLFMRLLKDGPGTYSLIQVSKIMNWDIIDTENVFKSINQALSNFPEAGYRVTIHNYGGDLQLTFRKITAS